MLTVIFISYNSQIHRKMQTNHIMAKDDFSDTIILNHGCFHKGEIIEIVYYILHSLNVHFFHVPYIEVIIPWHSRP